MSSASFSNVPSVHFPHMSHHFCHVPLVILHKFSSMLLPGALYLQGHLWASCSLSCSAAAGLGLPVTRTLESLLTALGFGARTSFLGFLYLYFLALFFHLMKHILCQPPTCSGSIFLNALLSERFLYSILVFEEGSPGHNAVG